MYTNIIRQDVMLYIAKVCKPREYPESWTPIFFMKIIIPQIEFTVGYMYMHPLIDLNKKGNQITILFGDFNFDFV